MSAEAKAALEKVGGSYIDAIDQANTARLKALLKKVSWLDLAGIKPDVAADAWMIVQHSDDLDLFPVRAYGTKVGDCISPDGEQINHSVDTKDHSISDEFISLLRGRTRE